MNGQIENQENQQVIAEKSLQTLLCDLKKGWVEFLSCLLSHMIWLIEKQAKL